MEELRNETSGHSDTVKQSEKDLDRLQHRYDDMHKKYAFNCINKNILLVFLFKDINVCFFLFISRFCITCVSLRITVKELTFFTLRLWNGPFHK